MRSELTHLLGQCLSEHRHCDAHKKGRQGCHIFFSSEREVVFEDKVVWKEEKGLPGCLPSVSQFGHRRPTKTERVGQVTCAAFLPCSLFRRLAFLQHHHHLLLLLADFTDTSQAYHFCSFFLVLLSRLHEDSNHFTACSSHIRMRNAQLAIRRLSRQRTELSLPAVPQLARPYIPPCPPPFPTTSSYHTTLARKEAHGGVEVGQSSAHEQREQERHEQSAFASQPQEETKGKAKLEIARSEDSQGSAGSDKPKKKPRVTGLYRSKRLGLSASEEDLPPVRNPTRSASDARQDSVASRERYSPWTLADSRTAEGRLSLLRKERQNRTKEDKLPDARLHRVKLNRPKTSSLICTSNPAAQAHLTSSQRHLLDTLETEVRSQSPTALSDLMIHHAENARHASFESFSLLLACAYRRSDSKAAKELGGAMKSWAMAEDTRFKKEEGANEEDPGRGDIQLENSLPSADQRVAAQAAAVRARTLKRNIDLAQAARTGNWSCLSSALQAKSEVRPNRGKRVSHSVKGNGPETSTGSSLHTSHGQSGASLDAFAWSAVLRARRVERVPEREDPENSGTSDPSNPDFNQSGRGRGRTRIRVPRYPALHVSRARLRSARLSLLRPSTGAQNLRGTVLPGDADSGPRVRADVNAEEVRRKAISAFLSTLQPRTPSQDAHPASKGVTTGHKAAEASGSGQSTAPGVPPTWLFLATLRILAEQGRVHDASALAKHHFARLPMSATTNGAAAPTSTTTLRQRTAGRRRIKTYAVSRADEPPPPTVVLNLVLRSHLFAGRSFEDVMHTLREFTGADLMCSNPSLAQEAGPSPTTPPAPAVQQLASSETLKVVPIPDETSILLVLESLRGRHGRVSRGLAFVMEVERAWGPPRLLSDLKGLRRGKKAKAIDPKQERAPKLAEGAPASAAESLSPPPPLPLSPAVLTADRETEPILQLGTRTLRVLLNWALAQNKRKAARRILRFHAGLAQRMRALSFLGAKIGKNISERGPDGWIDSGIGTSAASGGTLLGARLANGLGSRLDGGRKDRRGHGRELARWRHVLRRLVIRGWISNAHAQAMFNISAERIARGV